MIMIKWLYSGSRTRRIYYLLLVDNLTTTMITMFYKVPGISISAKLSVEHRFKRNIYIINPYNFKMLPRLMKMSTCSMRSGRICIHISSHQDKWRCVLNYFGVLNQIPHVIDGVSLDYYPAWHNNFFMHCNYMA